MPKWWIVLSLSYGLTLVCNPQSALAQGVSEYGAALGTSAASASAARQGAGAHNNAVQGLYGGAADSITKMTTGGALAPSPSPAGSHQTGVQVPSNDDLAPLMKVEHDLAGNEVDRDPRATVAAAGKIANKLFFEAQQKEKKGQLLEAEQFYLRSVRVRNQFWGDKDPAVVKIYGLLGDLEMRRSNPVSAETFYKRTLQLALKRYGPGSYEICPNLDALGNAFYAQKKYYDAANYFDQVHQLKERKLGQANPQTIASAIKLADAYSLNDEKGYWPDAEKLLKDNVKFLETMPQRSPQLIPALELYGRVLSKEGKDAEADKVLQRLSDVRSECDTTKVTANAPAAATPKAAGAKSKNNK